MARLGRSFPRRTIRNFLKLFSTPPATQGVNVWTGSAWVEKPVKVWSGSAWVTKTVKTWNGSAWV